MSAPHSFGSASSREHDMSSCQRKRYCTACTESFGRSLAPRQLAVQSCAICLQGKRQRHYPGLLASQSAHKDFHVSTFACKTRNAEKACICSMCYLRRADGGNEAASMRIAEQYLNAFGSIAKAGTTLMLPANSNDPASMVAQALSIYNNVSKTPLANPRWDASLGFGVF